MTEQPSIEALIREAMLMAEKRGVPHRMAAPGESEPAIDISCANLCAIFQHVAAQAVAASRQPRDMLSDLVTRFSAALLEKLRASEEKYGWKNGWIETGWEADCQQDLLKHLVKGDPRDVAAYCAFLWYHGWPTVGLDTASERTKPDTGDDKRAWDLMYEWYPHLRGVVPPTINLYSREWKQQKQIATALAEARRAERERILNALKNPSDGWAEDAAGYMHADIPPTKTPEICGREFLSSVAWWIEQELALTPEAEGRS